MITKQGSLALILLSSLSLIAMKSEVPYEHKSHSRRPSQRNSIYGITYADIDKVWEKAPNMLKNWVIELKEGRGKFMEPPRRLFIHGISGTGKTTLALGLQRQLPGWDVKPIGAGDYIFKHRGDAGEKLRKKLTKYVRRGVPIVIILDEAHILLEKTNSDSHDTRETSEALKKFLDVQTNNKRLMFIATGNSVEDMDETMNRRFPVKLKIDPPTEEELVEMFSYHASDLAYQSVDSETLKKAYKLGDIKVGRHVKYFVVTIKNEIRNTGHRGLYSEYPLSAELLNKAAKVYKENNTINIPQTERQFQRALHEDNKQFQKQLHEDGKKHNTYLGLGVTAVSIAGGVIFSRREGKEESETTQPNTPSTSNTVEKAPSQSNNDGKKLAVGGVTAGGLGAIAKDPTLLGKGLTVAKTIGAAALTPTGILVGLGVLLGAITIYELTTDSPKKESEKEKTA